MPPNLAKQFLLLFAIIILFSEVIVFYVHYDVLLQLGKKYLWASPLVFFKSWIKKILVLNFFGIAKLLLMIAWHIIKLLFIKLLKTIGIRYGSYFSQQKWQKSSQYLRVTIKKVTRQTQRFKRLIAALNGVEFMLVIIAFLPAFLVLFLFGIGFRMTRDVMVRKGSEVSMTKVAVNTAKKSRGLVAKLAQVDAWLLKKIESLV